MIHIHRSAVRPVEMLFGSLNVPLLDDEFDPGEEEIFDHNEILSPHAATDEKEDFSF